VVVECLAGELLSTILANRDALSSREARDIVLQAAAGLQAAHDVRGVHGNLSPDTILLTQTVGGYPIVKLIGFTQGFLLPGEARPPDQGQWTAYASPERIAGLPPDERSDQFRLGAVLYRLVTGVPPSPLAKDPGVPGDLQAVLDRALDPSPSGRYRTIAEFAAAIAPAWDTPAVVPGLARTRGSRAVELRSAAALAAVAAGLWLLPSMRPPAAGAPARTGFRESGSVPVVQPQAKSASARRLTSQGQGVLVRRDSAAVRIPAASSVRQPDSLASRDSASGPRISPFRRAHPWVAVPGERFYYRSGCPVALQSVDLLYFRSEAEAGAGGFVPSDIPECH
jgi:hypothetical protein